MASTRPTKSSVFEIGFRSAMTMPTGTAEGAPCCEEAGTANTQVKTAAQTARIWGPFGLQNCNLTVTRSSTLILIKGPQARCYPKSRLESNLTLSAQLSPRTGLQQTEAISTRKWHSDQSLLHFPGQCVGRRCLHHCAVPRTVSTASMTSV